jgi:hypothetical protein
VVAGSTGLEGARAVQREEAGVREKITSERLGARSGEGRGRGNTSTERKQDD